MPVQCSRFSWTWPPPGNRPQLHSRPLPSPCRDRALGTDHALSPLSDVDAVSLSGPRALPGQEACLSHLSPHYSSLEGSANREPEWARGTGNIKEHKVYSLLQTSNLHSTPDNLIEVDLIKSKGK